MKAKSYTITLQAIRTYTLSVMADDEEEAHDVALDMWCASKDPDYDYWGKGDGVEVVRVEPDDELFAQMEYDEDYYRATSC